MIASPIETGIGIGIISTGIPVYFLFVDNRRKKSDFEKKMIVFCTNILQKLFVVMPPSSKQK